MSELDQLKKRINDSGDSGVETQIIREDYEPAGKLMIRSLLDSGEYETRQVRTGVYETHWKIFKVKK